MQNSAKKRKHVTCALEEKLKALERLEKGHSLAEVAQELGVGITTVKDWRRKKKDLQSFTMVVDTMDPLVNRRTMKKPILETLDDALWIWFDQQRQAGVPLSGPLLKEKANSLFEKLPSSSQQTFVASEGWLHRWKKRHGVRQYTISGEKLSADNIAADAFVVKFLSLVEKNGLKPEQVYNIDETGLNYKMLPNKTLATKTETVNGTKQAKERLTIAPCSNASGTHKLPLFVIGKSKKPRAFKHLNLSSLPVYYKNQRSAWMDTVLFKNWFHEVFVPDVKKFLRSKNLPERAILLLDNAPSHPAESELIKDEIKAVFSPPNVTSVIQPMDQGVIECLKRKYRRKYLGSIVEQAAKGNDLQQLIKNWTVKDVIYAVAESWEEIPSITIKKSWKKLWPTILSFYKTTEEYVEEIETYTVTQDLQALLQSDIQQHEVDNWLKESEDDNNEVSLTDEEIIAAALHSPPDNEEDDVYEVPEPIAISHSEAAEAFEIGLRYVETHPDSTPLDILTLKRWRDRAATARQSVLQQTKITNFFPNVQ